MVKKAFMKTVEIMLVIVITTIFMLVIIPQGSTNIIKEREPYLIYLQELPEFRNFVSNNDGCFDSGESNTVDNLIRRYLPDEYYYTLCLNARMQSSNYLFNYGTPQKEVHVDTLLFAGNYTNINIKTVRLYYWSES